MIEPLLSLTLVELAMPFEVGWVVVRMGAMGVVVMVVASGFWLLASGFW